MITERATIYHLDLKPEHLPDTIITVGDPDRVKEVSKYFDKVKHKVAHREFVSHIGTLNNKPLMVVSTGIGPDNIDIVLNELDALANIDFVTRQPHSQTRSLSIIRMGTCGSLQKDLPVDSLITSSCAIGLDNMLHFYRFEQNEEERYILNDFMQHTRITGAVQPYAAEGSIALRKYFAQGYTNGITITAPGFYAAQGRTTRLQNAYPNLLDAVSTFSSRNMKALNMEMETAAIYGLGKIMGHKCMSISTVVANRADNTISKNIPLAVDNMIKHSLGIIAEI